MRVRLAVLTVVGLAVLGVSLHAATGHADGSTCWLCAICPFF